MANKKRLIDANKLRKVMIEYLNDTHGIDEVAFDNCFPYWIFAKAIEYATTVDAVEVVRCKDCKHYGRNKGLRCGFHDNLLMFKDDFCSYGERKNDGIFKKG